MEDPTEVPNSWPQNIFAAFGSIVMYVSNGPVKLAHGPLHAGYTKSHIWGYTPVNVCWILHAQLLNIGLSLLACSFIVCTWYFYKILVTAHSQLKPRIFCQILVSNGQMLVIWWCLFGDVFLYIHMRVYVLPCNCNYYGGYHFIPVGGPSVCGRGKIFGIV